MIRNAASGRRNGKRERDSGTSWPVLRLLFGHWPLLRWRLGAEPLDGGSPVRTGPGCRASGRMDPVLRNAGGRIML